MDMAGVGKPDYDFKSDSSGAGTYTATFDASELQKWEILEVAYHSDGDAKNMKNIKAALKGKLK